MEEDQIDVQVLEQIALGEAPTPRTLRVPRRLSLEALIRARVGQTLGASSAPALLAEGDRAVQSFLSNGFFVIVDELQREDLQEMLLLHPESTVRFIRLVPLVGG